MHECKGSWTAERSESGGGGGGLMSSEKKTSYIFEKIFPVVEKNGGL